MPENIVKHTEVDTTLMQLFVWLHEDKVPWLVKEKDRVLQGRNRTAIIVRRGAQYSLFVNKVADII